MTETVDRNEQGYLVLDGVPRLTPLSKFRSIDLVADVYAVLETVRSTKGHDSWWQVTVIHDFLSLLTQCGEGEYSIWSQPDQANRQSPNPDYVLRKADSDDDLTVEVTQIFRHPSRMKQIQFEVAFFGQVCTKLRGRVSGTFILILPQRPEISKAAFERSCGKIAEAIAAKHQGLEIDDFCMLPFGCALLKVSAESEEMAYATAISDNDWAGDATTVITNRSDCDRQLAKLFDEAERKFRFCSQGERVLLLGVDRELPVNVHDSAFALRSTYGTIDRCYIAPNLTLPCEFQRVW